MNLRIRKHTHHANICDVWLIKPIGGGARTCLMHGTVSEDDAKENDRDKLRAKQFQYIEFDAILPVIPTITAKVIEQKSESI
jgi:hypothetical protein